MLGHLNYTWQVGAQSVIQCVQTMILTNSLKNKDASWTRSIAVINIRWEELGGAHYKQDEKKHMLKHLIFLITVKG